MLQVAAVVAAVLPLALSPSGIFAPYVESLDDLEAAVLACTVLFGPIVFFRLWGMRLVDRLSLGVRGGRLSYDDRLAQLWIARPEFRASLDRASVPDPRVGLRGHFALYLPAIDRPHGFGTSGRSGPAPRRVAVMLLVLSFGLMALNFALYRFAGFLSVEAAAISPMALPLATMGLIRPRLFDPNASPPHTRVEKLTLIVGACAGLALAFTTIQLLPS